MPDINIDNIEYTIEINEQPSFVVELNEQGPQGARGPIGPQGIQGEKGDPGEDGADGQDGAAATIAVGTVTTGLPTDPASVTNVGTSSAAIFDFIIPKGNTGDTGATGNGVVNTEYISSSGLVDTYHINYTNGNYDSFTVTNGQNGSGSVADVQVNGVSVLDGDTAKITVPTDNTELTNGAGYITGITSTNVTTALGYTPEDVLNKTTTLTNASTYTQYPSAKTVYDELSGKQDTLVSGTNIKTINGNSILGSGNLDTPYRNIGEIVQSTIPLTDAGLHLLDGSLLSYGSYSAFIDYIADLYDSGNYTAIFETEANWQTSVTTYGVCGKFVYDSVNNTVRLPKITGFTGGTIDPTVLGDLITAGLPNITGSISGAIHNYSNGDATGAFDQTNSSDASQGHGSYSGYWASNINFDASRSSSIYGNSNTVQPQSIKVLYYIVITTSTKTSIEVDIDEIATDLNGKADTDLTNTTDAGYIKMAKASMPSDTYENLTIGATGISYTAPADGWVTAVIYPTQAGNWFIELTGRTANASFNNTGWNLSSTIAVRKGDTFVYNYFIAGSYDSHGLYFHYAVGSESEAS